MYLLRNTVNSKLYVGETCNYHRRLREHQLHPPRHLAADLHGHLYENIVVPSIDSYHLTRFDARRREFRLIQDLQTFQRSHGYNVLRSSPAGNRKFNFLRVRGLLGAKR